jgi:hypothetical protein
MVAPSSSLSSDDVSTPKIADKGMVGRALSTLVDCFQVVDDASCGFSSIDLLSPLEARQTLDQYVCHSKDSLDVDTDGDALYSRFDDTERRNDEDEDLRNESRKPTPSQRKNDKKGTSNDRQEKSSARGGKRSRASREQVNLPTKSSKGRPQIPIRRGRTGESNGSPPKRATKQGKLRKTSACHRLKGTYSSWEVSNLFALSSSFMILRKKRWE